jgi:hypothetical protein
MGTHFFIRRRGNAVIGARAQADIRPGTRAGFRGRLLAATTIAVALSVAGGALTASADPVASVTPTAMASIADATYGQVATGSHSAIERGHVQNAIAAVHTTADPTWTDVLRAVTPGDGEFSVGFDDGPATTSGLPEYFGTRVAIIAVGDGGFVGSVVTLAGARVTCGLPATIDSAAALLAAVGSSMTCPTVEPAASAITTVWAWGNSVDPADDNRGLGQAGMSPTAIAAFAHDHQLSTVYLSTPWVANQGAIAVWLSDTVDALHQEGVSVAALGGDPAWVGTPSLLTQWIGDALAAADFDAIQLDIEPWAGQPNLDYSTVTPAFVTALQDAKTAAGTVPLGADLPWWLTTKAYGSSTVFDALVAQLDTVAIVAFSDHADGNDGIVALSADAVASAVSAGAPFTIGVETDTPTVAGGAQYTFYDEGAAALETQTALVRSNYATTVGYRGITVEHLLAWGALGA